MLTGRTVSGSEALALGLVDRTTDDTSLVEVACEVARDMGSNSQMALRHIKALITENMSEPDVVAAQKREVAALAECYVSPEHKEAINAFIEKRAPDFSAARKT